VLICAYNGKIITFAVIIKKLNYGKPTASRKQIKNR
jgi:hypothetical protein